jgi:OFA family oxalate/formate antiporter-like MFS transporter
MSQPNLNTKNYGWSVVIAAVGINLALGILYTWSVISKGIPADWGWTESDKSMPYAVACLVFSLVMVPAGRLQDRIGPRFVATFGGVLVGVGMIIASLTTSPIGFIIGFGVLAGAGIGFGYATATPAAVKWFPPVRTGLIAGIVVSGFGLASVYAAPLSQYLGDTYGTQRMVLILGISFLVVVVGLSQLLRVPPPGFVVKGAPAPGAAGPAKKVDFSPGEMLKTIQFYLLWFMFACGAGAGLMIIAKLASIAQQQAGIQLGFILVAVLAIGNGGGRIVAGMVSDSIGRKPTLFICFVFQAILIFHLSRSEEGRLLASPPVLAFLSALVGANYGANLALFPAITKDFYGLKNFGVNYGLVFTSWGVGGFMLALLAGKMYDKYQTFDVAYYGAMGLLLLAAVVTLAIRPPKSTSLNEPMLERSETVQA